MKIINTKINDLLILEQNIFYDQRGWFIEAYSKRKFLEHGLRFDFVQDNRSFSVKKGTIRGLHFQIEPKAQTKLVQCIKGKIMDVAVDLRRNSSTYIKWEKIELSEDNKRQLLIPKGFAHGFLTLTDNVEIEYKVDEYYSPQHEYSIRYNDPIIGVQWGVKDPIISEKDKNAPFLNIDFM